ncbi:MAG: glycosyltransferase family 39 protein [Candidatus Omnitrophica bacterium]|nr:glycosyltransferase family 39 protein [Candidatus Omnitrophota bacterium]
MPRPQIVLKSDRVANKKHFIFIVVLIILGGAALRIYTIGNNDLWFDEAISVMHSEDIFKTYSLPNVELPLNNPAGIYDFEDFPYKNFDPQPPFYYVMLNIWMKIFGNSEQSIRMLSVLFSVLSLLIIYKFGNALTSQNTGLLAMLIMSLSPLQVWYAQEARGYTLSIFLILWAAYLLLLSLRHNKRGTWQTFTVVAIIAVYANYFAIYIIFAAWPLFLLKQYRPFVKKWFLINLAIMLSFLPWAKIFLNHFLYIKKTFWAANPSLISMLITFENFNLGYNAHPFAFRLSLVIFSILLLLGVYSLKREKRIILVSLLFTPIVTTFLLSRVIPIYLDRQLMIFSPFYYLIVAQGISTTKTKKIQYFAVGLIIILAAFSLNNYFSNYLPIKNILHHQGVHIKKPFLPAVDYIKNNWQENDIIVHGHTSTRPSFWYYLERYDLKQDTKNSPDYQRIWLVSSSWPRDGKLENHTSLLKSRLDSFYEKVKSKEFDGIFVDLYTKDTKDTHHDIKPKVIDNTKTLNSEDAQEIKKIIWEIMLKWPIKDETSIIQYISENYRTLHEGKIIDYAMSKRINKKTSDSFFQKNIIFIPSMEIESLYIKNDKAFLNMQYTIESFNIKATRWFSRTKKRKVLFHKENGEWKIIYGIDRL